MRPASTDGGRPRPKTEEARPEVGMRQVAEIVGIKEYFGDMLKKAAIVVLLGILGLVVGYASTWLGGHYYYVGTKLWLARDTPYTSHELMAMTRGHHPGAVVWADGSAVDIMATGSIDGAEHAVREAFEKVVVANDRKFQFLPYDAHFADRWGSPGAIRFTGASSGCWPGYRSRSAFSCPRGRARPAARAARA